MEENQNITQPNQIQIQNKNQDIITNTNPQPHHVPHNSFSNTNYNNIDLSLSENKKEENHTASLSYKSNQDYDIKVELDKNKNNKKFISNNNSYTNNYSKSPSYRNNKNINSHININKKPFFTNKNILLNKYSLKEVNECIFKDYAQLEKILPYYQNYYLQNKINNTYNNYNNYRNNYNNTNNINNNNDVILICLKYIEFSNFFFNNHISYKVQNLLFNIINGDRHILEQNKYSFLKNKLNEVYNKLIPYQIRYNYLKAFYDRNPDKNLYYLFKKDLDKISMSKPINKKQLNYLHEIFEIVKQKMETKKDSIKMYINRLLNISINSNINNSNNKNGGYYNNIDNLNNNNSDLDMSNSNDYTSYNPRRYSLHYTSSQNNNLSSYKNINNSNRSNYMNGSNRKNIDINNKEVSQFSINNHNNKGINYKQNGFYYKNNYKIFNNNDRDYIRNKNTKTNKFYKGELVEIEDVNTNKNLNVENENKTDDNSNQNKSNEINKEYQDFIDINKDENNGNNIYNSNENLNINLNNVKINAVNSENEFYNSINNNINNKNESDGKNIINMVNIKNQINANNIQNNGENIISENDNNIQKEKSEEKQEFINTDINMNSDDGHKVNNTSINDDSMDNGENIKNINADLNIDFLYNEDKKNNNANNEPKITYNDFNSSNNSLNMHINTNNNASNNLMNNNINNVNNNVNNIGNNNINQNNSNTMNKLKLNNIINSINNISNLNNNINNINDILKSFFDYHSHIILNMDNKIIPQFNQLMLLNNYQINLNNNFNVVNKYKLGIMNNLNFNLNSFNTHNNKNHNIRNNPFEVVRQEYIKLKALQKEKPQEIMDNMDLFENNILLPIYNEVNSNNNNSEIVSKYSKVYSKYKEAIESILKKNNLEGTIVEPYGSIVNNFLTKDGDIDISIVPYKKSKDEFLVYLQEIREELLNIRKYAVENQNIYINTRYILLSIMDIDTKISIDITVHNLLPINNSKMIRLYSLFDQRFHILGIFLKHWVKINNIKGAPNGYLSSYALLILIIHFLQNIVEPKILPVLQEIKKETIEYKYHNGEKELTTNLYYEQDFDKMKEYMNIINCGNENESSVTELLVQFFEYYSYIYNTNNNHYLISIKHSDKKPAINCDHMVFPIEDPFDVAHNPGKTLKINSQEFSDFIFCMKKEINNIMSGEYFKNTTVFG